MPLTLLENGQLTIASIVFATDLSPVSENAGLYAAAIAAHFQAELVVAHAFIPSQGAEEAELLTQHISVDRRDRAERLDRSTAAFAVQGLRTRAQLLDGDPSEELSRFADGLSHSILVLGTHGGSSFGRRLIGSVAERCLRRVACPTLTIGPNVSAPSSPQPFRAMLYATDASEMASRAAPMACAMAGSFQSELKVISIVDEKDGPVPDILADLDFRTHQQMDRQLPGACDHFTESRAVAKSRSAREEILRYASTEHADLLILGIHRRASLELFDRNSVTIQLIVQATCPVLTVTRGNEQSDT